MLGEWVGIWAQTLSAVEGDVAGPDAQRCAVEGQPCFFLLFYRDFSMFEKEKFSVSKRSAVHENVVCFPAKMSMNFSEVCVFFARFRVSS